MNSKHRKTLNDIFAVLTKSNIKFSAIESLIYALGGEVIEGAGSRVAFVLGGLKIFLHRPHPGNEAKKYQVELVREFLTLAGFGI